LAPVSANWLADQLQILSGGDQGTAPITIGGHDGLKAVNEYLNVADSMYAEWADDDTIDILMQVYGDGALLSPAGDPRNFNFLIGTLPAPNLNAPSGGSLPVEAKNQKWNWVLFRIANGTRPDGQRFLGTLAEDATGGTQAGGVNGGTIRAQGVPGLIVRVIAFGEQGAFGEPEQVNVFAAGEACDPEPATNLVFADFNSNTNNHLIIVTNNNNQAVTFQDNVGPAGDLRRAVRSNGTNMNFGITDNYLGKPCNDPRAMKLCVEFYDDPALAGTVFGPEAYATDSTGGTALYPVERRHTLAGSGQWVKRAFTISAVNLTGVNTAPLTGGPRLLFDGGQVFISRLEMGVFRVGTNALAGQDPLPGCFEDNKICTDAYGNFAELDLAKGIEDGIAPGSSGGDQLMVQEEAGPADDRRQAIRPDGAPGIYLNFAITDEALGPSTQDNARLAICVTYYDDPALTGATIRPEVYRSDRGLISPAITFTPGSIAVPLEGTGKWRDAYFEIPDMKFDGVNQGPQAAARFVSLGGQVSFTRVRYAVIRPCGPNAGVNLLADCKPADLPLIGISRTADAKIRLAWPTSAVGFSLQETLSLAPPAWTAVATAPVVENNENVVIQPINGTRFYRLMK
jgi:hypothetical protein